MESYFLKYKKFFRASVPWNVRRFRFLKYKEFFQGFSFLNYNNFFRGFCFLKYELSFEKIQEIFLTLELESSIFPEYKKFSRGGLFLFLKLALKNALDGYFCQKFYGTCLTVFSIYFQFYICHDSEYTFQEIRQSSVSWK